MHSNVFGELSLIIAIGAGVALIMRLFKQPLIIGHILTGILVGPFALKLVESPETIETFGNFGVALLLFIVGLGLNPRIIKEVGRVSFLTGVGQVIFTSVIGFFIVRSFGYSPMASFYISVALTFSSTIIILKLLTDKKEQNKLYGKISIGFLLVQDVIATIALVIGTAAGKGAISASTIGTLSIKGVALIAAVFVITRFVLRPLTGFFSKSQELLFLFAIAWGLGIASLFYKMEFSLEIGALIAGVALSNMTYAQEIGSRLRPLRDFFVFVFFIALGAKLQIANIGPDLWKATALSIFVLVGNPIIVMVIMGLLAYTKKTSFKAGLAVAQISEFSIIFMLLGLRNGHVTEADVSLVTIVGIMTIALSSYMIIYSDALYRIFEKDLSLFERRKTKFEQELKDNYDLVLFGYQKGGREFVKVFKSLGKRFVVIDYDPVVIDELEQQDIPFLYGDATDAELIEEAGIDRAKLVVSAITDHDTNTFLLRLLASVNPNAVTVVHGETVTEAEELYELGASYVVIPHYIGSEKISSFIRKSGLKKSEFKKYRQKHIEYLQTHYSLAKDA